MRRSAPVENPCYTIVKSRNCTVAVEVAERDDTAMPTKIVCAIDTVVDPIIVQFTPSLLE